MTEAEDLIAAMNGDVTTNLWSQAARMAAAAARKGRAGFGAAKAVGSKMAGAVGKTASAGVAGAKLGAKNPKLVGTLGKSKAFSKAGRMAFKGGAKVGQAGAATAGAARKAAVAGKKAAVGVGKAVSSPKGKAAMAGAAGGAVVGGTATGINSRLRQKSNKPIGPSWMQ